MTKAPRARIYLRVSRDDEDELRILENQEVAAREHVARKGYELAGVYSEVASGADPERVEFNRLMADVRSGDVVVFTTLSRVTREGTYRALEILRQLETRGARWNFTDQPFLDVDETTPPMVRQILLTILAELDADYRARIAKATRAKYAIKKAAADREGVPVKWGRPKGSKDRSPRKKGSPRSFIVAGRPGNRPDSPAPKADRTGQGEP